MSDLSEEGHALYHHNNLRQSLISIEAKKNVCLLRYEALTRRLNHHIIKGLKLGVVPDVDGSFDSTCSLPVDDIASTYASKDNTS
ncbi:hypothetical protein N7449_011708 [Penicillium cf. viridicatum]|uniref:Uncharacterized protein n=1 Tax=Penicillium cf. viridicatum TaxID=2972119 RepID=A0A9W9ITI5_9EURO|nr:hypothetical protein N7449_011708 [Penicillium cf. viridicatum]